MPGKENDARAEAILACFEALYRTALRLTGNKAQAEDLVQETYLRVWRSLSQLHSKGKVPSIIGGRFQEKPNPGRNKLTKMMPKPLLLARLYCDPFLKSLLEHPQFFTATFLRRKSS